MLKPARNYGIGHPDNGTDLEDGFYFVVEGPRYVGGRLGGYLNREQFNWLAEKIGTPKLKDVTSNKRVGHE